LAGHTQRRRQSGNQLSALPTIKLPSLYRI
jgi:hypothetical protein